MQSEVFTAGENKFIKIEQVKGQKECFSFQDLKFHEIEIEQTDEKSPYGWMESDCDWPHEIIKKLFKDTKKEYRMDKAMINYIEGQRTYGATVKVNNHDVDAEAKAKVSNKNVCYKSIFTIININ